MERSTGAYFPLLTSRLRAASEFTPKAPRFTSSASDACAGRHLRVSAGLVALLALLSLSGWILDSRALTSFLPGTPTLKVNTSLGLLCAASSLMVYAYLLSAKRSDRRERRLSAVAMLLAVMPLLIGSLTLVEYAFTLDIGMDQLLLADHWTVRSELPGRPTWFSAVALVLCSLPLLLGPRAKRDICFHASVLALSVVSWLNLAVFVFHLGAPSDRPGARTLSVSSALCFVALAYGAHWLRPRSGLMGMLLSDTLAGLSARRLLPLGMILPGVLGGIYLWSQHQDWFSLEVGLALFTTCSTVGYVLLTWLNARSVAQRESVRAEASALTAHALQRTETALATANAYLQAAPGAMFVVDRLGHIQSLNPRAERLFGYPSSALLGRDVGKLVAEDSRDIARELRATFRATPPERRSGLMFQRTMGTLRQDGTRLEVEVSLSDVRTEHGTQMIVSVHDLSAYRSAQLALQHLTKRYQLATEAARIGIWDWNLESGLLVWEPLMYEIYGLPEGAFSGTIEHWRQRVLPEDLPSLDREVNEAFAARRDLHTEFRIRRPDGSLRVVSGRGRVQWDETGRPIRVLGADTDITAQRDAEASLKASERRFRAIFDSTFHFMGLLSPQGTLLEVNRTALQFGDVQANDVLGKPFWETPWWDMSPAAQTELKQAVERAAQGEVVRYRATHHDLAPVVDFSLRPIRDEHGEVVLLLPEGRDISETEAARVALEESEERFRTAMEHAAIGIALVGLDGHFLEVNRALCELLGYSEQELLDRSLQQITRRDDLNADVALMRDLLAGKVSHCHMEQRYIHKQGHSVSILLSGALARKSSGEPHMFIAQIQDITAQKANEAQLRRSVSEKEVLLREIHHRVKNNLQVISSILRLQSAQSSVPEVRALFQDSQTRIQTMAMMHDRLYQSGSLAKIDFGAHLRELAAMLVRFYAHTERTIQLELSTEPATLNLDTSIPLGLIANELITNALKHAFQGRASGTLSIELSYREGTLVLTVADDGIGFPKDLDFSSCKSLGMRLIKALTRQLRGTIGIERLGRNALTVTVPIEGAR